MLSPAGIRTQDLTQPGATHSLTEIRPSFRKKPVLKHLRRIWTSVQRTWSSFGFSMGVSKKAVEVRINRYHREQLVFPKRTQAGKGTHTGFLANKRTKLLNLNGDQLRRLVRLLTGHCHLKGCLFKLGLVKSPRCERSLETTESATHILYECEAIACLRFRYMDHYSCNLATTMTTP
jgi:hypothetical protein